MQKHAREKASFDHDDVATWHTPRDMLQSTVEVCFVLELQITKWMPKNWAEFCLGGPSSLDRITCCQSLSPFTGIELELNWNGIGMLLELCWIYAGEKLETRKLHGSRRNFDGITWEVTWNYNRQIKSN